MGQTSGLRKGKKTRVSTGTSASAAVPDIFRDMLANAISSSPTHFSEDGRASKKRRVGGRLVTQSEGSVPDESSHSHRGAIDTDLDDIFNESEVRRQKIIQTEFEDSEESNFGWEEVDLQENAKRSSEANQDIESGNLNIVLGNVDQEHPKSTPAKRRPITAVERALRLEVHKMHSALQGILTKKTISYLNPDEDKSQFQRSRSFMEGVEQASDAFRARYKIRARGLRKSFWADSPESLVNLQPPEDIDLPIQLEDFRNIASQLEASRDVGAQLFCALLRSAGVDARLVCSLLPLPFKAAPKTVPLPSKYSAYALAEYVDRETSPDIDNGSDSDKETLAPTKGLHGRSGARSNFQQTNPKPVRMPIRESKYPVYWIEAFNEAIQKWIPVDPLVTRTIAKPTKLEPPAGERENTLSYVVAFEDDGSARDTTRRYARAYNAKTRRDRIKSASGDERWWRRVMKMYRRRHSLDRDQVEDSELASKEASEPMPRNVQDFKDHPYYALERHLKRHEVIHPQREVGKVGTGKPGSTTTLEPIFRRRDVVIVKSAEKWYRVGRELKPGEQPLKRVAARRTRHPSIDDDNQDSSEENASTALYAVHQTTMYSAPPILNGRIPKNIYGNLDLYVPSMVPPGGTHIAHPDTARAAKIIGVDYADAITGFSFKGRHGTVITNGAVVASEYCEAIREVITAFEDDRARAEEEKRSFEALRMWKRFMAGLRIRERIEGYEIEGERDIPGAAVDDVDKKNNYHEEAENEGGGFFPDQEPGDIAEPTSCQTPEHDSLQSVQDEGGGFLPDYEGSEVGDDWYKKSSDPFINKVENDEGGGFLVDDYKDAEEALWESEKNALKHFGLPSAPAGIEEVPPMNEIQDSIQENGQPPKRTQAPANKDGHYVKNERDGSADQAGGFSPDANQSTVASPEIVPNRNSADPGLSQDELAEARMLQQLYETGQMETQDPSPGDSSPPNARLLSDMSEHPNDGQALATEVDQARHELTAPAESSDEERGSLLSHDPDDEDADPEWLT